MQGRGCPSLNNRYGIFQGPAWAKDIAPFLLPFSHVASHNHQLWLQRVRALHLHLQYIFYISVKTLGGYRDNPQLNALLAEDAEKHLSYMQVDSASSTGIFCGGTGVMLIDVRMDMRQNIRQDSAQNLCYWPPTARGRRAEVSSTPFPQPDYHSPGSWEIVNQDNKHGFNH